jgi:hypothetical protein
MKKDVIKLDSSKAGSIELADEVFALEPRADILHRVVRWQRARAQAGTHKVKTRSEVSYSTKKYTVKKELVVLGTELDLHQYFVEVEFIRDLHPEVMPLIYQKRLGLWGFDMLCLQK